MHAGRVTEVSACMNPRKFTFSQPPKIPVPQGDAFAVADILMGDHGEPVILSRDQELSDRCAKVNGRAGASGAVHYGDDS
jgi:hypothetical protein